MIVVDASVWISLHLEDDAQHVRTDRWFREVEERRTIILAPTIMFAETAGALCRRTGSSALAQAVVSTMARLSTVRAITLDEALGLRAARLAADLRLRGADACYVAVAEEFGLPLVTWDDELLARAAGVVEVLCPE